MKEIVHLCENLMRENLKNLDLPTLDALIILSETCLLILDRLYAEKGSEETLNFLMNYSDESDKGMDTTIILLMISIFSPICGKKYDEEVIKIEKDHEEKIQFNPEKTEMDVDESSIKKNLMRENLKGLNMSTLDALMIASEIYWFLFTRVHQEKKSCEAMIDFIGGYSDKLNKKNSIKIILACFAIIAPFKRNPFEDEMNIYIQNQTESNKPCETKI